MKNFKDTMIQSNAPIYQAIACLESNGAQITLIVDEAGKLLGTITDGDVRRGLLKGIDLNEPVTCIMNPKPLTIAPDSTKEQSLILMKANEVKHITCVDKQNTVQALYVIDDILLSSPKRSNKVVIIAGGLSQRLRPITESCPKPMLEIGGQPLLETIILQLKEAGFEQIIITVNYLAHMIQDYFQDGAKWGLDIQYIKEKNKLGTAGALSLIEQKIEEPFLVMNGDLLTRIDYEALLDFHITHHATATMEVRSYEMEIPYGVVRIEDQKVTQFDEKPIKKFFVNAGLYVFSPAILQKIPKGIYLDMPALLTTCIENHLNVVPFPVREYWRDIGHHQDFEKAHQDFDKFFNIYCSA